MTNQGWSAADVPDLSGQTIVVTGATNGIGLAAARVLADRGAHTVLAARSAERAEEVIDSIRAAAPHASVEFGELDLDDLGSVESFSDRMRSSHSRLDVLVNNAGIMLVPFGSTADGNERHFGTNHLGHFALTGRLFALLEAAPAARVVTVSSIAHHDAHLDFDNLQYESGRGYTAMGAYRRSKLANLLFALELDRRLRSASSSVRSIAAHPGVSNTNLANHLEDRVWWKLIRPVVGAVIQDAERGALPTLRAATAPDARGGQFFGSGRLGETTGPPILVSPSELASDAQVAARLWQVSEELTGVRFP